MAVGVDIDSAVASMPGTSSALEGAKTVMLGIARHSAMSSRPWWLGPSSPVMPARSKTKTTGRFKQPDVEVGLVEGAREERRVDRDDRLEAAHGHARRRGDGVLLGDADVEEPVGEALLEAEQPGGPGHRGGDRDDRARRRSAIATSASEKAWVKDCGATSSSSVRGGSL